MRMMRVRRMLPAIVAAACCAAWGEARAQSSTPRARQQDPAPPAPPPLRKRLPAGKVDLSPNFTRGDSVELEWRRSEVVPLAKGKVQTQTTLGTARVSVETMEAWGFVLSWTWGELKHAAPGRVGVSEDELIAAMLSGARIDFDLSRTGEMRGVRGWERLSRDLAARLADAVDARRPALGENAALEQAGRDVRELIRTRESLETLVLDAPATVLGCLPGELSTQGQTHADAMLPNPFGSVPFPASASFAVLDLTPTTARVAWGVSLKQEHVAGVMARTVRDLQVRAGRKKDVPKVHSIAARSQGEALVMLGSTWPVEGRLTYTLTHGGTRSTTTSAWKRRDGTGAR